MKRAIKLVHSIYRTSLPPCLILLAAHYVTIRVMLALRPVIYNWSKFSSTNTKIFTIYYSIEGLLQLFAVLMIVKATNLLFPLPKRQPIALRHCIKIFMLYTLFGMLLSLRLLSSCAFPSFAEGISQLGSRAASFPWLYALLMVIPPALSEELIFRGGIFRYCQVRHTSKVAFWVSAIVFNLFHSLIVFTGIKGIVSDLLRNGYLYTAAYWLTGQLYAPTALHMTNNLMGYFVLGMNIPAGADVPPLPMTTGSDFTYRKALEIVCFLIAYFLYSRANVREVSATHPHHR